MSGKPRKKFVCEDHTSKRMKTKNNPTGFIKGCGFEFLTCGNPQHCPRCHVELPEEKDDENKR